MMGVSAGGGNLPHISDVAVAVSAFGEDVEEGVASKGGGLGVVSSVEDGEHPAMRNVKKPHIIAIENKIVVCFLLVRTISLYTFLQGYHL